MLHYFHLGLLAFTFLCSIGSPYIMMSLPLCYQRGQFKTCNVSLLTKYGDMELLNDNASLFHVSSTIPWLASRFIDYGLFWLLWQEPSLGNVADVVHLTCSEHCFEDVAAWNPDFFKIATFAGEFAISASYYQLLNVVMCPDQKPVCGKFFDVVSKPDHIVCQKSRKYFLPHCLAHQSQVMISKQQLVFDKL